jgi:hypothetical protein
MSEQVHRLVARPQERAMARALVELCSAKLAENDEYGKTVVGMRGVEFYTPGNSKSVIVQRKKSVPAWLEDKLGGTYLIESRAQDEEASLVVSLTVRDGDVDVEANAAITKDVIERLAGQIAMAKPVPLSESEQG